MPGYEETPRLSIIIPAFNEEHRLPKTLRQVEAYLGRQGTSWELLVVDDGSTDGTVAAAEQALADPRSRILQNPRNVGKGATVRHGMLAARGERRLFTDADLSTPIEELAKLLQAVEDGAQVAIGSRGLEGSRVEVHQALPRETMGKIFNLLVRALVLRGIRDTQCGFKLFTREAAEYIFRRQRLTGWAFDVEILALARRGGYRIAEVGVVWRNSPATRVAILRDPLLMLRDLLRLKVRQLGGWKAGADEPESGEPG